MRCSCRVVVLLPSLALFMGCRGSAPVPRNTAQVNAAFCGRRTLEHVEKPLFWPHRGVSRSHRLFGDAGRAA